MTVVVTVMTQTTNLSIGKELTGVTFPSDPLNRAKLRIQWMVKFKNIISGFY